MPEQIRLSQLPKNVQLAISNTIEGDIIEMKLLSGGLSQAQVIRIDTNANVYLLKITQPTETRPATLHQLAARSGIAPAVHYSDHTNGILITNFLENKPLPPEKAVKAVAQNLKSLQALALPAADDHDQLQNIMDQTISWFTAQSFLGEEAKSNLNNKYASIKAQYPWHDHIRVISHNDLNPRNVLFEADRCWFIDWDAASINDPFVDLAIAAIFFAYTPALEHILLDLYFENAPEPSQLARFHIMKQLCRFVYASKLLQIALTTEENLNNEELHTIDIAAVAALLQSGQLNMDSKKGQLWYGRALFNEALKQLNSNESILQLSALKG